MSKSILSYFTVLKKQTAKVADDDSDVIPESPEVQVKKKKKSKKRQIEDSDEEIFSPKKKKVDTGSTSQSKHKQKSSKLKEIPITDLFGTSKIKKTESLVVKDKKTETGIHSDEEFEQSLLELDGIESCQDSETQSDKIVPKVNDIPSLSATKDFKSSEKWKNHDKSNHGPIVNSINEKLDNIIVIDDDDDAKSHTSTKSHEKYTNKSGHSETPNSKKKRNLSEFLDDEHAQSFKKQKHNVSLNDSALTDQDRHERKRMSAELYQRYLNRTGPKHLGAKEMPEGSPDCLKNCAFLLTGVLDSFERDEIVDAITKYGGTVRNGVSRKVTHVLAGEDAGPAKTAKAEALGIKIINEDQFLDMITELSNKSKQKNNRSKKRDRKSEKDKLNAQIKKETVSPDRQIKNKERNCDEKKTTKNDAKVKKEMSEKHADNIEINDVSKNNCEGREKNIDIIKEKTAVFVKNDMKTDLQKGRNSPEAEDKLSKGFYGKMEKEEERESPNKVDTKNAGSLMWVDKYKPENIKQIIGQHGDASNVKKLMNWLTKWYVNRKAKLSKPNPWAKNDDGGFYKAALLSGPPGIGKTTTVSLVCKELGFDMVEFNASDTRSKSLIKEQISELLTTTSLSAYAKGVTGKQAVTKKHVLVMDEVDGMAGNEDRGGLQELISLIKTTSVPVICMCNDRNSEKMRSLVNYCYDLRFSRPGVHQIKAAMMRICFKEGVKVPPDVLCQLIIASGQDVRQTLHLLSVLTADVNVADHDNLQRQAQRIKKDVKMGPWDATRKVFSADEHKTMSIIDRSDLFFTDYSLAPLFVHENYPQVVPRCPKKEIMDRVSKAVDSISLGDLVDSRIRSNQAWSLLPLQAMYSSVIPGQHLSGHVGGQIQFPGWLGKNSRANKMARLAQTIHAHTRLSTSGSKSSIFLDYSSHLRDAILNPLIKDKNEGIAKSLQVLEEYHLLRDDLDSLTELSLWPGQRNPNVLIDAKTKAAMTRTYNKQASALPYAPGAIKTAKHQEPDENYENYEEDVEDDSDMGNDALIKKKKAKDVEKPSSSKEKPQSSKGKGKKTKLLI